MDLLQVPLRNPPRNTPRTPRRVSVRCRVRQSPQPYLYTTNRLANRTSQHVRPEPRPPISARSRRAFNPAGALRPRPPRMPPPVVVIIPPTPDEDDDEDIDDIEEIRRWPTENFLYDPDAGLGDRIQNSCLLVYNIVLLVMFLYGLLVSFGPTIQKYMQEDPPIVHKPFVVPSMNVHDFLNINLTYAAFDDGATWRPNQRIFRNDATGGRLMALNVRNGRQHVVIDDATGEKKSSSSYMPYQKSSAHDFQLSADGQLAVLMHQPIEKIYRHSVRGRYVLYQVKSRSHIGYRPRRLSVRRKHSERSFIQYVAFGPRQRQMVLIDGGSVYYYADATDAFHDKLPKLLDASGRDTIFNGVPNWQYEEAIFGRQPAVWWSPNGEQLAYARFDESRVPYRYSWWRYASQRAAMRCPATSQSDERWHYELQPSVQTFRSALPGTENPTISMHVIRLERVPQRSVSELSDVLVQRLLTNAERTRYAEELPLPPMVEGNRSMLPNEYVLAAAGWVTELMLVTVYMNRQQNRAFVQACRMSAIQFRSAECWKVTTMESYNGWLPRPTMPLLVRNVPLEYDVFEARIALIQPTAQHQRPQRHEARHNQLVSYRIVPPVQADKLSSARYRHQTGHDSQQLHIERVVHWASEEGVIFYLASNESRPQDRHLYAVHDDFESISQCVTCMMNGIVDEDEPDGYTHFDARFSPHSNVLELELQGPGVPQLIMYEWFVEQANVLDSDSPTARIHLHHLRHLVDNWDLQHRMRQMKKDLELRKVRYLRTPFSRMRILLPYGTIDQFDRIRPDGPPPSRRSPYRGKLFPLLVQPSNGPETFLGTSEWRFEFGDWMATDGGTVVVQVDARGSSRQNLHRMYGVKSKLGLVEAVDLGKTVNYLLDRYRFLDAHRVGIWGDDYAGYVAGMAATERSREALPYKCAAMVSPMMDWSEYPTLYAERYMGYMRIKNPTSEPTMDADSSPYPNTRRVASAYDVANLETRLNTPTGRMIRKETQLLHINDNVIGRPPNKWLSKGQGYTVLENLNLEMNCRDWEEKHYFHQLRVFFDVCFASGGKMDIRKFYDEI